MSTLFDGRYRYINAPREELYDVQNDPGQHDNLAGQKPDVIATFRNMLKGFVPTATTAPMAPVTDEDRGRYEALGTSVFRRAGAAMVRAA